MRPDEVLSLSHGAGKIRDQMAQILYNPARVSCRNLVLRAPKRERSEWELVATVAEDWGERHALCRRYAMEFWIRPKGPFDLDLTLQRYRLFGDDAAHSY